MAASQMGYPRSASRGGDDSSKNRASENRPILVMGKTSLVVIVLFFILVILASIGGNIALNVLTLRQIKNGTCSGFKLYLAMFLCVAIWIVPCRPLLIILLCIGICKSGTSIATLKSKPL